MNKKLIFIVSFTSLLCIAGFACLPVGTVSAVTIPNPLPGINNFGDLILKIIEGVATLVSGLAVIMFLISGIYFLTSAGNPGRIQTAKSTLVYACVGIVVGLSARAITGAIVDVRGGASDIPSVLLNIAKQVGNIMAGLGTVMVIISGIMFLMSFGSPEKMKTARTALVYAIIGIVIGLTATTIVSTIISWTA